MFTFSMRPDIPHDASNKCINFEQERASWALSTFSEKNGRCACAFGLAFYSPLEAIDISVMQLAALVAGLDTAYEDLCNAIFADAPAALARTPWKDVATFMDCIPRGLYATAPDVPCDIYAKDAQPVPFLFDPVNLRCLAWTGSRWGVTPVPDNLASYSSAGTCFGWDVLYREDIMSTECVRDPDNLVDMVGSLLEAFSWFNTDAKLYVYNLYSVQ